jgi:hypothetical protein
MSMLLMRRTASISAVANGLRSLAENASFQSVPLAGSICVCETYIRSTPMGIQREAVALSLAARSSVRVCRSSCCCFRPRVHEGAIVGPAPCLLRRLAWRALLLCARDTHYTLPPQGNRSTRSHKVKDPPKKLDAAKSPQTEPTPALNAVSQSAHPSSHTTTPHTRKHLDPDSKAPTYTVQKYATLFSSPVPPDMNENPKATDRDKNPAERVPPSKGA